MLTFGEIAFRTARNIQIPLKSSDGAVSKYVQYQIVQFLQRAYEHLWNSKPWPQTLSDTIAGSIAAGTNYAAISKQYGSILRAHDSRGVPIRIFGTQEFADYTGLASNTTTNLIYLAPFGYSGVATQLTASQIVRVVSSTSQDGATSNIQVVIKGLNDVSEMIAESLTVNGTTANPTAASFSRIDSVSKNRNSAGTISIKTDDEVTTLATIGPFETSPRYPRYRGNITPSAAVSFNYIAKLRFVPFLDMTDVAIFDMDAALESRATELAFAEHRNTADAEAWAARAADDESDLVRREMNSDGSVELMVPAQRG